MAEVTTKTMAERLEDAAPYNLFYNAISEIPSSKSNLIYFKDLLCPSLGQLEASLQITDKMDFDWLYEQYEIRNVESLPLNVVYNDRDADMEEYVKCHHPNVSVHSWNDVEGRHGNHHAKMGIYRYDDDSLRVVVYTANLYRTQWEHFTHGIWVSPPCRRLPSPSTAGDSPTHFKKDLLTYLESYSLEILRPWIDHVTNADFNDVKVFLVTSLPGIHSKENPGCHMQHVKKLLEEHCPIPENEQKSWTVVAQASNMGMFGNSPNVWLGKTFLNGLGGKFGAKLKIVFPTWWQVKNAFFGGDVDGGGLRYLRNVHNKQLWIMDYLYKWEAKTYNRTNIMPHTKFYLRVSFCNTKAAWILLSSGNINKGAWGQEYQPESGDAVDMMSGRNHEIGVMFFPKFFDQTYFQLKMKNDEKVFPLIFDLPLKKYGPKDHPWSITKPRVANTK